MAPGPSHFVEGHMHTADLLERWRDATRAAELADRLAEAAAAAAMKADIDAATAEELATLAEAVAASAATAARRARDVATSASEHARSAREETLLGAHADQTEARVTEADARDAYHEAEALAHRRHVEEEPQITR